MLTSVGHSGAHGVGRWPGATLKQPPGVPNRYHCATGNIASQPSRNGVATHQWVMTHNLGSTVLVSRKADFTIYLF